MKMKKKVYERQVSMIDGLVSQGASVEELAYFFNMDESEIEGLLVTECIEIIIHRNLSSSKIEFLEEKKAEFINNLIEEEGFSDADVCSMFHMDKSGLSYYRPSSSYSSVYLSDNDIEAFLNSLHQLKKKKK